MKILNNLLELQEYRQNLSSDKKTLGLVPTMGNLHSGHLSLLDKIVDQVDKVMVSIFVNPSQFAPHEDYAIYPRTLEKDLKLLATKKCDVVFCPSVDMIYEGDLTPPKQYNLSNYPDIEPKALILCGKSRPHFFYGVVNVVGRLFEKIQPNTACFGEKDYQQLLIIRLISSKIFPHIKIVNSPIIRENNGLAMSSRNNYLNIEELSLAGKIYQSIKTIKEKLKVNKKINSSELINEAIHFLSNLGIEVEYLEIRDNQTLELQSNNSKGRLFIACRLKKTRLIDNILLD